MKAIKQSVGGQRIAYETSHQNEDKLTPVKFFNSAGSCLVKLSCNSRAMRALPDRGGRSMAWHGNANTDGWGAGVAIRCF